jgi:hypothetical protein
MISEVTDEEIKVDIMNKLLRKGCWGAKYLPVDTLINWLAKKVKKDGKRVRKIVKELVDDGYLRLHKNGQTISLNPTRSREIIEYIEGL